MPEQSLTYVNDKFHKRHEDAHYDVNHLGNVDHQDMKVSVDNMYGEKGHRLMSLEYNFYLNYVYDYKFTDYIGEAIFKNSYYQVSSADSKTKIIQNYNESCFSVINTYNHLHS